MDTGFRVVGNLILGPRAAGVYRLENGRIYGPDTFGDYHVGANGRIYGPTRGGQFSLAANGRIYGPTPHPPWLPIVTD
jgi:hypothetical protein